MDGWMSKQQSIDWEIKGNIIILKKVNMGCVQVSYDRFCKSISNEYKIRQVHHPTKHLQPADVSWNKSFKEAHKAK